MRMGWWIVRSSAVALAAVTAVGCASSDDDGIGATQDVETNVLLGTDTSIFGGARDDDDAALPSVVALKIGSGRSFELCSGTLVAPNVILTARHCVANSLTTSVSCNENGRSTNGAHLAGDQEPSNVAVYVGASPKFEGAANARGKAIVAPKVNHFCDSDIALVVLDRAVAGVEPVPVRLHAGVAAKETVRSVGYGQNDKRIPTGTRLRKAGVEVLARGKGVSPSRTALGPHEFEVGRSICQGDSGGPAISENTGAVVGVVSRGGKCDDDFGHIYTTTAGWSALFDEAFAIAGGAPVLESGKPIGTEPGADVPAAQGTDQPRTNESCSSGAGRPAGGGASLALVLACALVLRARSRRSA